MTIEPNFEDDFAVLDGVQSVTPQVEGDGASEPLVGLVRPLSLREIEASAGAYLPGDARWHFDAPLAEVPEVGAIFIDAESTSWTVLERRSTLLGARGSCIARRVASP